MYMFYMYLFKNLFILQTGQNRNKILHLFQQDIPKWLSNIKVISSFFYTEYKTIYR